MGRKTLSDAEKEFMNTVLLKDFNNILDTLVITDVQRKIAELYYFRGFKMIDIAYEMDLSEKTVSSEIKNFARKLAAYSNGLEEK